MGKGAARHAALEFLGALPSTPLLSSSWAVGLQAQHEVRGCAGGPPHLCPQHPGLASAGLSPGGGSLPISTFQVRLAPCPAVCLFRATPAVYGEVARPGGKLELQLCLCHSSMGPHPTKQGQASSLRPHGSKLGSLPLSHDGNLPGHTFDPVVGGGVAGNSEQDH